MPKKSKQSGGVMPRNTRQGFRSEALARFALSAFGPAIDVEPEDDHGFDLVCATSKPSGKRLHVGPGYYVQVKSQGALEIRYKGDNARAWLEDLGIPMLVCVVDKTEARLRLYSTWNIARVILQFRAYGGDDTVINLVMDEEVTGEQPPPTRVPLGPPIVAFHISELDDAEHVRLLGACIEEWVLMDTENIVRRRLGLAVAKGYTKWETNKPPSAFHHWYEPFFYSNETAATARKVLAECASLIALGRNQAEIEMLGAYVREYCDWRAMTPMHQEWLGLVPEDAPSEVVVVPSSLPGSQDG